MVCDLKEVFHLYKPKVLGALSSVVKLLRTISGVAIDGEYFAVFAFVSLCSSLILAGSIFRFVFHLTNRRFGIAGKSIFGDSGMLCYVWYFF